MMLFLDIDGVMVPAKGHKLPDTLRDGFPAFSTKATAALNTLISRYDPTVMLTTSHKGNYSIEGWKQLFATRGIVVNKLESLPTNIGNLSRKDEIVRWIDSNDSHSAFIILDDDKSLNALSKDLKKCLVLTAPMVGLTQEHLNKIEEILLMEETT